MIYKGKKQGYNTTFTMLENKEEESFVHPCGYGYNQGVKGTFIKITEFEFWNYLKKYYIEYVASAQVHDDWEVMTKLKALGRKHPWMVDCHIFYFKNFGILVEENNRDEDADFYKFSIPNTEEEGTRRYKNDKQPLRDVKWKIKKINIKSFWSKIDEFGFGRGTLSLGKVDGEKILKKLGELGRKKTGSSDVFIVVNGETKYLIDVDEENQNIDCYEVKKCFHEYTELSQQEAREKGVSHFGMCYHVLQCIHCDQITAYDSSG